MWYPAGEIYEGKLNIVRVLGSSYIFLRNFLEKETIRFLFNLGGILMVSLPPFPDSQAKDRNNDYVIAIVDYHTLDIFARLSIIYRVYIFISCNMVVIRIVYLIFLYISRLTFTFDVCRLNRSHRGKRNFFSYARRSGYISSVYSDNIFFHRTTD